MTRRTDHEVGGAARAKSQEIVEGLQELAAALRTSEPLEARFTVRTYRIAPPPAYGGEDVRRVRDLLGTSQAAFAGFLGVDPSTVRSWEQGLRSPSTLACRILSEIEANPTQWHNRLAACLISPQTRGAVARTEVESRRGKKSRTVDESR